MCEWPWLVPRCANGPPIGSEVVFGGAGFGGIDQYNGLGVLGATRLGGLHGPLQQPVAKVYSNVGTVGLVTPDSNFSINDLNKNTKSNEIGNAGIVTHLENPEVVSINPAGVINSQINNDKYTEHAGQYQQNNGLSYQSIGGINDQSVNYRGNLGISGLENGELRYTKNGGIQFKGNGGVQYQGNLLDIQLPGGSYVNNGLAGGDVVYGNYGAQYVATNEGLSVRATQALQNAGLLKASDSAKTRLNYNIPENYVQYAANTGGFGSKILGQNIGLGVAYTNIQNTAANNQYQENANSQLKLTQEQDKTINSGPALVDSEGYVVGLRDTGNQNQGFIANTNAHLVNGLVYDNNLQNIELSKTNTGAKSHQSFTQYHGQDSTQQNQGSSLGSGTSGNINIIGGGYSAVSVLDSGIEISNNGEDTNTITRVAQLPIPVTTSIPTVTSVPLPNLNVASGFESFKGGVVANIPELQYKVQKPVGNVLFQPNLKSGVEIYNSHDSAGVANISTSFVNLVSSTPASVNVQTGYHYPKPSVAFVEGAADTTILQNPAVSTTSFVKQPVIVSSTQTPLLVSNYNIQKPSVGYSYPKPTIQFEEAGLRNIGSSERLGGSYSYQRIDTVHKNEGYSYPRPSTNFQEVPLKTIAQVQPTVQTITQPIVKQQSIIPISTIDQKTSFEGYQYKKPSIIFEENPQIVVSSTPAPIFQKEIVQPTIPTYPTTHPVSYSTFHEQQKSFEGYNYRKPTVVFEEKPQIQVTSYKTPSSTIAPVVYKQPQVYISSTPVPAVKTEFVQPIAKQQDAISYSSFQQVNFKGYDYPKPTVAFEEKPIVQVTSYDLPSTTLKPLVVQQPQVYISSTPAPIVAPKINTVVEQPISYATPSKSSVTNYNYQNVLLSGYSYPKPAVTFEETPAAVTKINYQHVVQPYQVKYNKQPAVISSYSYTAPATQKPEILPQQPVIVSNYRYYAPTTPKPIFVKEQPQILVQKQPAVVSSYSYTAPSTQKPEILVQQPQQPAIVSNYHYYAPTTPKPEVFVEEQPQPVVGITYAQPAAVDKTVEFKGYSYPKPSRTFVEERRPVVTYENREPVEEVPFVAKKAYVTGGESTSYQYKQQFNTESNIRVAQKPVVIENYQAPLQQVPVTQTYEYKQQYSKDSGYVYEKPEIQFEDHIVENYEISRDLPTKFVSTTKSRPIINYSYVQTSPKPTFLSTVDTVVASKVQPINQKLSFTSYDSRISNPRPVVKTYTTSLPVVEAVTTSRPIAKYSFSSLDDQTQYVSSSTPTVIEDYVAPIEATTLRREYLPPRIKITSVPDREYLPVRQRVKITTPAPTTSYIIPEVRTPERDYLPVKTTITPVPVLPTRTYLPVDKDLAPSRRPAKIVKVVRPKAKTIVKINDFHPLLSAKLGAQCTCVSNTVKLRKQPLRIVVDDEQEDDDDGYVVDQEGATIVENYEYEPKKIVDITPTPQIEIKSTTNLIEPVVTYRKRVRVRPASSTYSPVTEFREVLLKKTPALPLRISTQEDEGPSDREIAKAVRTGLKLVKQAAKEGAKEGTEEVLSKDFDRYGPGGVRSRNERLQGTIDCQRAGLFRHPTQCNKFYACRWDCTKNRYTLHVFNCPVHLTFDNSLGACNWPSQGPACLENTLLPSD